MATFTSSDDLRGSEFVDADLSGSRFVRADLRGAVMREAELDGLDLDSPWLIRGGGTLLVNGVDVVPLVDAELDRRFPGRALRRASDPDGLRTAWAAVEEAWAAAVARAAALPAGSVDVSVGGEWSFAQTLRHLVMATDIWLRKAVLGVPEPFHPLGVVYAGAEDDGFDFSVFTTDVPSWEEVLEARAGRMAMVRDFVASVTAADLDGVRANPWAPARATTVLSCLQVILGEEWDHLRYALRDLDVVEAGSGS